MGKNQFTGTWIHRAVMNDYLGLLEKAVVAIVAGIAKSSKDSGNKYECSATNAKLASMLGVSESSVAHAVSRLKEYGDFTAYGGRYRKLIPTFYGKTGPAQPIWIPKAILERTHMTFEQKAHLAFLFNLMDGQASVHEDVGQTGVHHQKSKQAAEYLGISKKTIQNHRRKWLADSTIVNVKNADFPELSGYKLSLQTYDEIRSRQDEIAAGEAPQIAPEMNRDMAAVSPEVVQQLHHPENPAFKEENLACNGENLAFKEENPAFLYESDKQDNSKSMDNSDHLCDESEVDDIYDNSQAYSYRYSEQFGWTEVLDYLKAAELKAKRNRAEREAAAEVEPVPSSQPDWTMEYETVAAEENLAFKEANQYAPPCPHPHGSPGHMAWLDANAEVIF